MKRDWELVKSVMLNIESPQEPPSQFEKELLFGRLAILQDAGLIAPLAAGFNRDQSRALQNFRLTWDGHEFLDAARKEEQWSKTLNTAKNTGISLTFDVLKSVLSQTIGQAARAAMGL